MLCAGQHPGESTLCNKIVLRRGVGSVGAVRQLLMPSLIVPGPWVPGWLQPVEYAWRVSAGYVRSTKQTLRYGLRLVTAPRRIQLCRHGQTLVEPHTKTKPHPQLEGKRNAPRLFLVRLCASSNDSISRRTSVWCQRSCSIYKIRAEVKLPHSRIAKGECFADIDGLGPVVSPGCVSVLLNTSSVLLGSGWLLDRPLKRFSGTWRRQAGGRAALQLHDVPWYH